MSERTDENPYSIRDWIAFELEEREAERKMAETRPLDRKKLEELANRHPELTFHQAVNKELHSQGVHDELYLKRIEPEIELAVTSRMSGKNTYLCWRTATIEVDETQARLFLSHSVMKGRLMDVRVYTAQREIYIEDVGEYKSKNGFGAIKLQFAERQAIHHIEPLKGLTL